MKLAAIRANNYRSLRDTEIYLDDLNLFIGANASGKSCILDALRFLNEGIREKDFRRPVQARGGIIHLAWKGEEARQASLTAVLKDSDKTYEWHVNIIRKEFDFQVEERLEISDGESATSVVLKSENGKGSWWSDERKSVKFEQGPTSCSLASASADVHFPGRDIAAFVEK